MSCESENTTVGPFSISFVQWPCTKSVKFKFRLASKLGPVLDVIAKAFKALESGKLKEEQEIKYAVEAINAITRNNDPDEILQLIIDVLQNVRIKRSDEDGDFVVINKSNFDAIFSPADMGYMYLIFIKVIGFNYKDLIPAQRIKEALGKMATLGA